MKKPPPLSRGSVVRIISTARKITPAEVEPSIRLLKSWGLDVELGRNLYAVDNQFAGTREQRLQDLQEALNEPRVNMIWCSRGGYGTVLIIDDLNFNGLIDHPKWVVGYSDATSLLCHIVHNLRLPTIHATMPINVYNQLDDIALISVETLKSFLFGNSLKYALPAHHLNRPGVAEGTIIGGNLSILYSLMGSISAPDTNDKILFIEDLDEYLYHIDRMMVGLRRSGMLNGLSALIVGGMTEMNDNTVRFGKTAEEIIFHHVKNEKYPVYFGFSAGHLSPNHALPFGVPARIQDNSLVVDF